MCIEKVLINGIIDTLSHFYQKEELLNIIYKHLLYIFIEIVNIINRGRVRYLTPQIKLTVVHALITIPNIVCTFSLITVFLT